MMTTGSQNPKNNVLTLLLEFLILIIGKKIHLCELFLEYTLYLFDSIFSRIVWIDKVHDLTKEFVSLTIDAMEIGKRQFLSYRSEGCHEGKCFIKNINLIDVNCHRKNCWWIGLELIR